MNQYTFKFISIIILSIFYNTNYSQSVLKVNMGNQGGNSRSVQIGHADYRWLSLGKGTGTPNYGAWGIEYDAGGLNFWKPCPTANCGNYKMHIHDEGFVGVNGIATPSRTVWNNLNSTANNWKFGSNFRLQVFGNAIANDWFIFSDSALKENIAPIGNVMSSLMKMTPIEYNYKSVKLSADRPTDTLAADSASKEYTASTEPTTDPKRRYGFTAQEVKRVFPNLQGEYNENVGVVNYVGFVPLLVSGVQEHQRTIDTLKKTIDSLHLQIQNLRQEIVNWKGRTIDTSGQSQTRLFQNNPNPFDGQTTISYYIDENTVVNNAIIEVRNIMGNLQSTLTLSDRSGLGSVDYDGSSLPQGYYIYTLKINGSVKDSKLFLKEQ